MHIFKILGTCGQSGLQKKWSNLHLNPALNENTQDWGGFFGIVFLCYCGSVVAAIRSSPKSRGLDLKSTGPMCRILGGPWTWMRKKKSHVFIFIINLQLKCSSSFHHERRLQIPAVLPVPVTLAVPSSTEITDVFMPHYLCCRSPKILFMLISASKLQ